MSDLTEFLLARVAEDEAVAALDRVRAVVAPKWRSIPPDLPEATAEAYSRGRNDTIDAVRAALYVLSPNNCGACRSCVPAYPYMRVCRTCGDKRCPHAADHREPCSARRAR